MSKAPAGADVLLGERQGQAPRRTRHLRTVQTSTAYGVTWNCRYSQASSPKDDPNTP